MERGTGIEPVTSSLGSWHSTAELPPLYGCSSGRTPHPLNIAQLGANLDMEEEKTEPSCFAFILVDVSPPWGVRPGSRQPLPAALVHRRMLFCEDFFSVFSVPRKTEH